MEATSGYIRFLAKLQVEQNQTKPLFGKPHLKLGQCIGLWGYFYQLGAVLGDRHSSNLDAFGPAFLGAAGPPGAVKTFFDQVASDILSEPPTTFTNYIIKEYANRCGYTADLAELITKNGLTKIPSATVAELAWQYSQYGAAIGAIDSTRARTMFELSHPTISRDRWDEARAAGLAIPKEQDNPSYKEVEQNENSSFMDYCQNCIPEYHAILAHS